MKSIAKKIVVTILTIEARLILKKYKPKIVAITGTVGKTSTKDMVYSVFSNFFYTRKSEKSFNGEIGIPLTIVGCDNAWSNLVLWLRNILKGLSLIILPHSYPDWLILEVGADRPGDIKSVTKWLHPDITIITRLSNIPVHVEFFKSAEEVKKEKTYLAKALKSEGSLVLNADDEDVLSIKESVRNTDIWLFGHGPEAEVQATNYEISYEDQEMPVPIGVSFKINQGNNTFPVMVKGSIGRQIISVTLAGFASGFAAKLSPIKMLESIGNFLPPPGRMRLIRGVKGSTIVDDSYNSSPTAVAVALTTLKEIRTPGKKFAVLGDMMELGKHSAGAHQEIGKTIAEHADVLITVGVRAREIAEVALQNRMDEKNIFQFEDSREAGKKLELMLDKGDVALIKGSQAVRMERTVKEVMEDPLQSKELLCRQDEEWLMR
ncbi:MAG: hypothetical protein COV70_02005 [Parcubacteria group bacterium CG11_big_fil_rev_8_21_14_0_20_39_22]|nr:MAG: hypothetical protein COV70_02005 [Parcubacteria group bacterium CG11_big_fil_rev_8_21_14_0_20_39_22]